MTAGKLPQALLPDLVTDSIQEPMFLNESIACCAVCVRNADNSVMLFQFDVEACRHVR